MGPDVAEACFVGRMAMVWLIASSQGFSLVWKTRSPQMKGGNLCEVMLILSMYHHSHLGAFLF